MATQSGKYTEQLPEASSITGDSLVVLSTGSSDQAYKATVDQLSLAAVEVGSLASGERVQVESLSCEYVTATSDLDVDHLVSIWVNNADVIEALHDNIYVDSGTIISTTFLVPDILSHSSLESATVTVKTFTIANDLLTPRIIYETTLDGNINIPNNSFVRARKGSGTQVLPALTWTMLTYGHVERDQHQDFDPTFGFFHVPSRGQYHVQVQIILEATVWDWENNNQYVMIGICDEYRALKFRQITTLVTFDQITHEPNTTFDLDDVLYFSEPVNVVPWIYIANTHLTIFSDGIVTYTKLG